MLEAKWNPDNKYRYFMVDFPKQGENNPKGVTIKDFDEHYGKNVNHINGRKFTKVQGHISMYGKESDIHDMKDRLEKHIHKTMGVKPTLTHVERISLSPREV